MAMQISSRVLRRSPGIFRPLFSQQSHLSTSLSRRIGAVDATRTLTDPTLDNAASATSSISTSGSESTEKRDGSYSIPSALSLSSSQLLPYHVSRTPSNNLPVYTETRNGKTRKETIIRKIAGDARPLRDAIRELLQVETDRVWIGKVTGHVYVKGHHKSRIEKFLAEKGF